jgi:ferredoxin--NADP+ reductase
MRFACIDGPEFDAHEVDFDELVRRNRTYVTQERQACERASRPTNKGTGSDTAPVAYVG